MCERAGRAIRSGSRAAAQSTTGLTHCCSALLWLSANRFHDTLSHCVSEIRKIPKNPWMWETRHAIDPFLYQNDIQYYAAGWNYVFVSQFYLLRMLVLCRRYQSFNSLNKYVAFSCLVQSFSYLQTIKRSFIVYSTDASSFFSYRFQIDWLFRNLYVVQSCMYIDKHFIVICSRFLTDLFQILF